MIYVIGHKSPDSDTVCSSLAVANLKKQLGFDCEARVAGEINEETKFVLKRYRVEAPSLLMDAKDKDIILVDHSDLSQAVDGAKDARIVGIVDHHKLGDVSTTVPTSVLIRPLGCCCTIVKGLFNYYKKEIPKDIAGLMLCAILSDTVIFRSPTTTDEDRRVAKELAEIAGEDDLEKLGMEMFRVKSAVDGIPASELVIRDYKDFEIGGHKIGVGQLELVDLNMVSDIREDLVKSMEDLRKEGRSAVFLMLTDIMKRGSDLLCVSEDSGLREKIFGKNKDGWFDGMMSRKKQIVPELEKYFTKVI